MKVLLISANAEKASIPPLPLGPALIAAACRRAGHEASLLDLMFAEDPPAAVHDAVEEFRPDVIGVSVRNIDDQNMASPKFLLPPVREIVAACRGFSDAPIVLGGAGYSIFPESALSYLGADMGVRGEGETLFPELLDRLARGAPVEGLPGLYLPNLPPSGRVFADNLDGLALPEPGGWIPSLPSDSELWVPVQSRRGCPLDCTYCSTSAIEGRGIRRRSPRAVVEWMSRLVSRGFHNFHFVDNTFNLPPYYAKALCRGIIQEGLDVNLWCIIYPKWIDRELTSLLARAGCREASLGFEGGSDHRLASYNKQFNTKEVRTVSRMFGDAGIRRIGFLLLGGPGETRESVEESLAFADSLGVESLKVTIGLRIYPQTPLAATARAEGVIDSDDNLLQPRFYLAPSLRDWLPERIAAYSASRPWVL